SLRLVVDHLFDELVQDLFGSFLSALNLEVNVATALDCSENHCLITKVSAAYMTTLSTDVGLVAFNNTFQHFSVCFFHCLADGMAQIPSRFVAHFEHSLKLVRRDCLFGLDHEVDGKKPFPKRQVSIFEDSSHCYGELVAA